MGAGLKAGRSVLLLFLIGLKGLNGEFQAEKDSFIWPSQQAQIDWLYRLLMHMRLCDPLLWHQDNSRRFWEEQSLGAWMTTSSPAGRAPPLVFHATHYCWTHCDIVFVGVRNITFTMKTTWDRRDFAYTGIHCALNTLEWLKRRVGLKANNSGLTMSRWCRIRTAAYHRKTSCAARRQFCHIRVQVYSFPPR